MRQALRFSFLSIVTLGALGWLGGCSDDSELPAAKTAEEAVGIPADQPTKTVQTKGDVNVVKDIKVIDAETGKTISETHETTPVKITRETKERVNVDVNVGETKATTKGDTKVLPVK